MIRSDASSSVTVAEETLLKGWRECIVAFTEMKLLSVENYDQRPALEGKLLTIACSARGSEKLHFQWLKVYNAGMEYFS